MVNLNWQFNPENCKDMDFALIPVGDHRVRIDEVEAKVSKGGNTYFEITLAVSGYNSKLWHYITLLPNNPDITNNNLNQLFNGFGIANHDLNNFYQWIGKAGAVRVKHKNDDYGEKAVVSFILSPSKAEKLPPWKEPSNGLMAGGNSTTDSMEAVDADVPW